MKKYDHANAAPYTVDLLSRRGYKGAPLSAAICKESRSRDFCDITLHVKYLEFTATHFFCFQYFNTVVISVTFVYHFHCFLFWVFKWDPNKKLLICVHEGIT